MSPEAIFELAGRLELAAISITDHDTLEGTLAGRRLARRSEIRFLTGVEILHVTDGPAPSPSSSKDEMFIWDEMNRYISENF